MTEKIKEIFNEIKNESCYTNDELILTFSEGNSLVNYITNLQKENEELLKKLEDVSLDEANIRADILLEQQDYKQRNKKAVEYIKIQQKIFKDYDIVSESQLNNLLNILQGGDE